MHSTGAVWLHIQLAPWLYSTDHIRSWTLVFSQRQTLQLVLGVSRNPLHLIHTITLQVPFCSWCLSCYNQDPCGTLLPVTKLEMWTTLLTFMILQGTVPKEKTEHSGEAQVLKIYCVRHWNTSIRWKFSSSMSTICINNIRLNFSSTRRRCTHFI